MFKKMRSINLSYEEQGYIYFLCRTYEKQSAEVRKRIREFCGDVGNEHKTALFKVLTTGKGVRRIALEFHVSESVLYELRKRFYEKWRI